MASGKRTEEMELRILDATKKCRHFRGIQHDTCLAGVNTRQLVGGPDFGWACRLPCFPIRSAGEKVQCDKYCPWTVEEATANEEASQKSIQEFLSALNEGKCPTCKVSVKQRQVGHCVYGTCGHRLYQGRVDPQFAEAL